MEPSDPNIPDIDPVSPDDELEASRVDSLNTQVGDNELPEDNDPPAADADDTDEVATDDTHPSTDSDVDETEAYDQGL